MIHAVKSLEEIQNIIKTKEGMIILNFHSETCGPCIMQMPILEDLSNELKMILITCDVDNNKEALEHFKITATPTTILYKNGKSLFTNVGFFPYDKWKEEILKLK
ncbi:MAG: thioredoxin family protein [Metamycoplasmataceae bacterium]